MSKERLTVKGAVCQKDIDCLMELSNENQFGRNDAYYKLQEYEDLEEQLESVYGECDGLLEKVIDGLVKHEGVELEKPMKARLLTDEDVDKWDRLKDEMERIVERLEEELNESLMQTGSYEDYDAYYHGEAQAFRRAIGIVEAGGADER